jgi:hypothetical protein
MTRGDGWSRLFATAFKQSRNAMALVDAQRVCLDVNGSMLALLGYRTDDLIGWPIGRHVVGGPRASAQEWERALATGRFDGLAAMPLVIVAVVVAYVTTAHLTPAPAKPKPAPVSATPEPEVVSS